MARRETDPVESRNSAWTRTVLLAAAVTAGATLCYFLALPFIGPIVTALTLAILFAPLHARIEPRFKHPSLAALVSVFAVLLIVAVPATFVVERLVAEAAASATLIQQKVAAGAVQEIIDAHPTIAPIGRWIWQQFDLPSLMSGLATWLSNFGASFVRGSLVQVAGVALAFYLLFYFLRDRRAARLALLDLMPLTQPESERLFQRTVDTVRAIVYGTVAVAIVQGALGGLMFWILGLPAALLWGLVMAILSVVPVLGSFVVWIPASLLLALNGDWVSAIILAAWGSLVIGNIDNILRPMLVGNRLQLHTVPAFISMIGGLVVFGLPGFILGPLTVTLTLTLIDIWRGRTEITRPTGVPDAAAPDKATARPRSKHSGS
ncbi:AI-2E family transporter [Kaistia algarum]|uniref:AI-2E family transporter n=1 Tax=Kaistia algarum TaxID=2083279 RepID=UPI000CE80921|nr:AI-2E family transporter [Kaistia algarum]MCX5516260.1 AI-2E family transporter [Kaistia algarum]PPE77116.1 AI-2E family transporter [Kaistia algarum]